MRLLYFTVIIFLVLMLAASCRFMAHSLLCLNLLPLLHEQSSEVSTPQSVTAPGEFIQASDGRHNSSEAVFYALLTSHHLISPFRPAAPHPPSPSRHPLCKIALRAPNGKSGWLGLSSPNVFADVRVRARVREPVSRCGAGAGGQPATRAGAREP